jgi:hypothetical protein
MDVEAAARRWAETWQHAWPAKQAADIAALYDPTASYRSSPSVSRSLAVRWGTWSGQFAVEEAVKCRFGEPIASGERVVGQLCRGRSGRHAGGYDDAALRS